MVDTSNVNLLSLIGSDTNLKKVASTGGGEYQGSCPFCGGVDRFGVQPNNNPPRWHCRNCSPQWGDAVNYIQRRENLNFVEACEKLGIKLEQKPQRRRDQFTRKARFESKAQPVNPVHVPQAIGDYDALDNCEWQKSAREFVLRSEDHLWSDDGKKALDYLNNRGLLNTVIEKAWLGFNPSDYRGEWGGVDVWLPRGIIIPWRIDNQFWRVNVRPPQAVNGRKYIQAKGSANGLYNADAIQSNKVVLMVEGEFDALAFWSEAPDLVARGVIPVATGTVSWARLLRWVVAVGVANNVLLAFDSGDKDGAGDKAAEWWLQNLGKKAQRLAPTQHDLTDMIKAGDCVRGWIESAVTVPQIEREPLLEIKPVIAPTIKTTKRNSRDIWKDSGRLFYMLTEPLSKAA